jgi:subtilisin family serine protease
MHILLLFLAQLPLQSAPQTDALRQQARAAAPDASIPCLVQLEHLTARDLEGRASVGERLDRLREHATRTQAPLLSWCALQGDAISVEEAFWLGNVIHLEATPSALRRLAQRPEVRALSHNGTVSAHTRNSRGSGNLPWNLDRIDAGLCWDQGFDGSGVTVAVTDTGIDPDHPAFADNLTGPLSQRWYDAVGGQSQPYDDNGHGTHVAGSIVGGDGLGPYADDVGVAPGARLIVVKMLDSHGIGDFSEILNGLQWLANLRASVDFHVVSGSWGINYAPDLTFWSSFENLVSLDVLPVISIGNAGPGAGSTSSPGNFPFCLSVGATNENDRIAGFSSRGPAPNQSPWSNSLYWYRPDWNLIQPDVCAPGVSVRSTLPGGGFGENSGTSMATPHVAGAAALLLHRNPSLSPADLYGLLRDGVDEVPLGAPYPNSDYGWGRLNAFNSLVATPPPSEPWLFASLTVDDTIGGDGDGLLEAGESATLVITLENIGGVDALNPTVGLVADADPYFVADAGTHQYPDLAPAQSEDNSAAPFSATAHDLTPAGHPASVTLTLSCSGGSTGFYGEKRVEILLGESPAPIVFYAEDFEYTGSDSFVDHWATTGGWAEDASVFHSPTHSATNGGQPASSFERMVMIETVDIVGYPDTTLEFWQRYNFNDALTSTAQVQASTTGGGGWQTIQTPLSGQNPLVNFTRFTVPLADFQSDQLMLRFRYKASPSTNNHARWWVDDLVISTPVDNEPPLFDGVSGPSGVRHRRGPFPVAATVVDEHGLADVVLRLRVNGGAWTSIPLVAPAGSDVYAGQIPALDWGDRARWYLEATDLWPTPNTSADPLGAPADGTRFLRIQPSGLSPQ